jgi:hypothetical protein
MGRKPRVTLPPPPNHDLRSVERMEAHNREIDGLAACFLRIAAHERRNAERRRIGKEFAEGALGATVKNEERAASLLNHKFAPEIIAGMRKFVRP